jgi:hypothetical protein
LPALCQRIKSSLLFWIVFLVSIFPVLRFWDEKLWPNDLEVSRRTEWQRESAQLRDLAVSLQSPEMRPFLTVWWLSPAVAYWSGQPGIAGSSHESLDGIAESARFFLSADPGNPLKIVENHKISWIIAYDADRTAVTSSAILGVSVPEHALCYVLDRAPTQAPRFLIFSAQNPTAKLFRVSWAANDQ